MLRMPCRLHASPCFDACRACCPTARPAPASSVADGANNHKMTARLAATLSPQVTAHDMPGFGLTTRPPGSKYYTMVGRVLSG